MFNLIANAMFEATRTPSYSAAPVRKRWFGSVSGTTGIFGWKRPQAGKIDTAPDS